MSQYEQDTTFCNLCSAYKTLRKCGLTPEEIFGQLNLAEDEIEDEIGEDDELQSSRYWMRFRFTQYEIHGQEVAVDAATEDEARLKILSGEGDAVGESFYVCTDENTPLKRMED
jgi:hypothetical protein